LCFLASSSPDLKTEVLRLLAGGFLAIGLAAYIKALAGDAQFD